MTVVAIMLGSPCTWEECVVALYICGDDFQRMESHLLSLQQVLLPQFPERRDMVWVCGEKQLQATSQVRSIKPTAYIPTIAGNAFL